MRKFLRITCLLWMIALPCALIAGGVANNPQSQVSPLTQGPDPTGNAGYPLSVVNATGTTLDISPGSSQWITGVQGIDAASGLWTNINSTAVNQNPTASMEGLTTFSVNAGYDRLSGVASAIGDYPWGFEGSGYLNQFFAVSLETTSLPVYRLSGQAGSVIWREARTPDTFNTVSTAAAGNTIVWTPAAGAIFRLLKWRYTVTGNATTAGGAVVTISLNDAGVAIGQADDVFIPAVAASTQGQTVTSPWIDLGTFGVPSSAPNNVLNVNLSAALTAGSVRVQVCGTEE